MWRKWKESEFFRKLKQVRVNRAVYLSAIVILLSLSVVLAITAVTNRRNQQLPEDPSGGEATLPMPDGTQTPPPVDDKPSTPTVNENTIPEFALPVSGKLSEKHSVEVQVFSDTMKDYRVHLGIDIATAADAPVCAVADGTVAQVWEDPMMGWCVALSHAGDCVTVYKNLASNMAEGIAAGATVKKGQLIAYVGESALMEIAEEPHLHMEMTVKGLQVDPLEYFSKTVIATITEDDIYESGADAEK